MSQDTRARFIFIVILSAFFAYIVAPIPGKPTIPLIKHAKINLGIDLAGGAELRYRVLYPPGHPTRAADTKAATDILRNRIEGSGLKEPKINDQGDDEIVIQLAGVDQAGLDDYKKLIEQAGKLELFGTAPKDLQERFNKDGKAPAGYKSWVNDEKMTGEGYDHFAGEKILLKESSAIEGRHIASAKPEQRLTMGGGLEWVVAFELTVDGAKLFDQDAKELFNHKPSGLIAIVLDGKIISKPVVRAESYGGSGTIEGRYDEKGARHLSIVLRHGSLPAPIGRFGPNKEPIPRQPEAESFVGPTLGQDAINRGLWSSGLTLVFVALFMLIYYRSAGFVAVVSLALNMVFLMGIMAFFGATLTLPGIAGIVLTVGMAVDANILVFERIREEQAKGKSASQAFEAGHERAFWTILDSNLTTLVAALVLYWFGTGPVKGFAVSLSIGILTTLFSVLYCGKTFLKMQITGGLSEWKMMRLMADPKVNFLGVAKACVVASVILVVGGTAFFVARGQENFGIDFRGGSSLTFGFNGPQQIDAVRERIQSIKGPGGLPKYADAQVQTVAEPGARSAAGMIGRTGSTTFQLRCSFENLAELKEDIQRAFAGELSREPFEEMKAHDVDPNARLIAGGPGGPGWFFYVKDAPDFSLEKLRERIAKHPGIADAIEKDAQKNPAFLLEEVKDPPKGLRKLKLTLTKKDSEGKDAAGKNLRLRFREELAALLAAELPRNPFTAQGQIGPAVASELKNSTFWAMVISWALMIVYVAVRFASWRYGVAAVLALVHDALVAVAFTSLAGAVVPRSWGLSFEMNLTTMAAILTIIGYSINDTIVIFDRIRENLILMRKATFTEIINVSVNQTMSRTILTSFTVWISALVLYLFTMNTGGGIAEFAFPLLIGVISGTYSTIYIAAPVVLWWYRGQRPATP